MEDAPLPPHVQKMISKFTINDFNLQQVLGEGRFGKVWLAREKSAGYDVAIKVLEKAQIHSQSLDMNVLHELFIHSQLVHDNIIGFFTRFHDENNIYFVMEYAPRGSLFQVLQEQPAGCFEENLAAKFTSEAASALMYIHSRRYVHGDLKPENILLDDEMNVKLCDFGFSWPYDSVQRDRGLCGTVEYLAPEVISQKYYDMMIDHWSLGVLIYEMLSGKSPFHHKKQKVVKTKIMNLNYKFPKNFSDDVQDLISKLLIMEPGDRLQLDYVQAHPWIQRCYRPEE